jgi:hypothetical protein
LILNVIWVVTVFECVGRRAPSLRSSILDVPIEISSFVSEEREAYDR